MITASILAGLYLILGLAIFRGSRAREFLEVIAWPLALIVSLIRRVRRDRAMEPANSLPGRVVPPGVPIVKALREGSRPIQDLCAGAEEALLGAMIFDNGVIAGVLELVPRPEMFTTPPRQEIFSAIVRLHRGGKTFDLVALRDELARRGQLDAAGGPAYLAHLVDSMPSAANALEYARAVREKSIVREAIDAHSREFFKLALGKEGAGATRDEAEKALFEGMSRAGKGSFRTMGDVIREVFHKIEALQEGKREAGPIATGFHALDVLTGGLHPGCLHVVAGRPSMGKTAFVLGVVANAALKDGKKVLLFSPEAGSANVTLAMLSAEAGVDMSLVRRGRMTEGDFQKLILAAGSIHEAGVFIDDTPGIAVSEILRRARGMRGVGIDLVVVDGLGAIRPEPGELPAAIRLKALAWELGIPVLATAPLGRGVEQRKGRRPMLADLVPPSADESADLVLFLHREDYYDPNSPGSGVCDVIVAKNRHGGTGTVTLLFRKHLMRFEDPGGPPDPAGAGKG